MKEIMNTKSNTNNKREGEYPTNQEMSSVGDLYSSLGLDALGLQLLDLAEEARNVKHDSVADEANGLLGDDARRNQMKSVLDTIHNNSMTRISFDE